MTGDKGETIFTNRDGDLNIGYSCHCDNYLNLHQWHWTDDPDSDVLVKAICEGSPSFWKRLKVAFFPRRASYFDIVLQDEELKAIRDWCDSKLK